MDLSFSEQLLRLVFSTFCGQRKKIKFENIVVSALKSCIEKRLKKNLFWGDFFFHVFVFFLWAKNLRSGPSICSHICATNLLDISSAKI